jgi:hypothetical protein
MGRFVGAVASALLILSAVGAARSQSLETVLEGLDDAEVDQTVDFIVGNAMFVLFHEAGHMLVSEFGIPVLGREEDAVDSLSALIMLQAEDETLDTALVNASDGWFLSAQQNADADYAFWDEHSLDEQRAYAIVCLMVGKDADRFAEAAADAEMPGERVERCAADYEQASQSWSTVLDPHGRSGGGPGTVNIIYQDAALPELESYAELIKEADFLGFLKTVIVDEFALTEGITFQAASCGQPNAFWSPSNRTLTFCHELTQYHAALIAGYIRDNR